MPSVIQRIRKSQQRRREKKIIKKISPLSLEAQISRRVHEIDHLHAEERRFLERILAEIETRRKGTPQRKGATEQEISDHLKQTFDKYPVLKEILERKPPAFVKALKKAGLEKVSPSHLNPDGRKALSELKQMHSPKAESYDREIEKFLIKRIKKGVVK